MHVRIQKTGFRAPPDYALRRLDILAGDQPWLLPVTRARRVGQQPKLPYINPRAINEAIESMPGVSFSTHAFRAALATYGTEDLGWTVQTIPLQDPPTRD